MEVLELYVSVVPPTAMTLGEHAGYSAGTPPSPVAARNAMFAAVKVESFEVSPEDSLSPQLIETTVTPEWVAAFLTAAIRLASESLFAS